MRLRKRSRRERLPSVVAHVQLARANSKAGYDQFVHSLRIGGESAFAALGIKSTKSSIASTAQPSAFSAAMPLVMVKTRFKPTPEDGSAHVGIAAQIPAFIEGIRTISVSGAL